MKKLTLLAVIAVAILIVANLIQVLAGIFWGLIVSAILKLPAYILLGIFFVGLYRRQK